MVAVRRQVLPVLAHRDDRIEEASDRFDHAHQPFDVRVGRIALVRRRFDAIDRQRDEQQRRAAERIAVAAHHGAAVRFDLGCEAIEIGSVGASGFRRP